MNPSPAEAERGSLFLFHGLHLNKPRVVSVESKQVVMRATLHYAAFVEHTDPVGVLDGREAVGYDESSAVFHQPFRGFLYQFLARAVKGRSGLVENEHGGFLRMARAIDRRWR